MIGKDVSWLHDIFPSKINSNLNCRCQLTCDDWGIPNTKLKYYHCTSTALLCCKNTQIFNCIWQIIAHEWWIWIVPFIPLCYKTSSHLGGVSVHLRFWSLSRPNRIWQQWYTRGVCTRLRSSWKHRMPALRKKNEKYFEGHISICILKQNCFTRYFPTMIRSISFFRS